MTNDDDQHQIDHGEQRAVADVRAVAVLAVDEARDEVGGAAGAAGGDVDNDIGELQLEDDADDDDGHRDRQHQREGDLPEGLPAGGAIDASGLLDLAVEALQAGEQHDHHERDEGPGVHDHDGQAGEPGAGEEGGIVPAEAAGEPGERAEADLEHRLADHPADRDGREHQRHQEDDAPELAGADFGGEQQREAEGDGVLDEDRQHVPDHVAQRVPVERIVPHLNEVGEAVETPAGRAAEVPVREGDPEAEDEREDHHRHHEEDGRKHE